MFGKKKLFGQTKCLANIVFGKTFFLATWNFFAFFFAYFFFYLYHRTKQKLYWCYYPQAPRDSVSTLCRVFFLRNLILCHPLTYLGQVLQLVINTFCLTLLTQAMVTTCKTKNCVRKVIPAWRMNLRLARITTLPSLPCTKSGIRHAKTTVHHTAGNYGDTDNFFQIIIDCMVRIVWFM